MSSISVEFQWIKPLPIKDINRFEDRMVYNVAVYTREYAKGTSAFPRRTGKLQRSEVASPVVGNNKNYGLVAGTDYAKYVWRMNNVKWTNPSTKPQWYYTVFKNQKEKIMGQALGSSLKGLL